MKNKPELSIIIVNYNTKDLTIACLESIFADKTQDDAWEVIVVDNKSTDGSVEALASWDKRITLIQLDDNYGFAKANNVGIRISTGELILLLNSDTVVSRDAINAMITFMQDHPEAGAATCAVRLRDGTLDPASHRGFPTPWAAATYLIGLEKVLGKTRLFGQYHQGYKNMDTIHQIDSPSGAFFLVRRSVTEKVGLLDERFFMYAEDLDWAYRMKKTGVKIYFNPHVSILHLKKQSGRAHADNARKRKTQRYFWETMLQFYTKHYSKRYSPLMTFLVTTTLRFRLMLLGREKS